MIKMAKLFVNEYEEVSTKGTKLARLIDVKNQMCLVGDLALGVYQIVEGVIEICGEDEDYEVVVIGNLKVIA